MNVIRIAKDIVKRQFLSGVLVVVPLIITYIVLRFLFEAVDGILSPLIEKAFGYSIPGLGIAVTILIIILAGFLTRNILGATLYHYGDKMLVKTPIIRIFYLAAKQLIQAVTVPQVKSFKEVVMIEYPRPGLFALGFTTTHMALQSGENPGKRLIGIFMPSTPTPFTGWFVLTTEDQIIPVDMTVEEAVKLLVSAGVVAPDVIKKTGLPAISK